MSNNLKANDLILIKLVKYHQVLWNENTLHEEIKSKLWNNISKKIGIGANNARNRWFALRERYVNQLKLVTDAKNRGQQHPNSNSILLNKLDFLKEFIKPREISQNTDDENLAEDLIEFSVSHDDIVNDTDEDTNPDHIFMELTDDEELEYEEVVSQPEPVADHNLIRSPKKVERNVKKTSIIIPDSTETKLKPNATECTKCEEHSKTFNEDKIFGDLVVAMLVKMDENAKKKVKLDIMSILLK